MHEVKKKHANALLTMGSDFTSAIQSGDSLTGTPVVAVHKGTGVHYDTDAGAFLPVGPWEDVTAEFVSGTPSVSGSEVLFFAKARAASGEQARGTYVVRVEASTTNGEKLVDTFNLEVVDEAT